MKNYLDLLRDIRDNGTDAKYRNGVRRSITGPTLRFDFKDGFPLVTTKKINYRNVFAETLMFVKGITNTRYLKDAKATNIWSKWELKEDTFADDLTPLKAGDIGPMYGGLWRGFPGTDGEPIDQLKDLVSRVNADPYNTRHYVSAFHPSYAADTCISPQENIIKGRGCLNPCHPAFQLVVRPDSNSQYDIIDLVFNMTSSDVPIGLPYNIAGYGLLLVLFAYEFGAVMGELVYQGGNSHIYENQLPLIDEQLNRKPYPLPSISIENFTSMFDVNIDDIKIHHYEHHPHIPYIVS